MPPPEEVELGDERGFREELGALLECPPPEAGPEEAQALAREHFGIHGVASPLGGERDRNFRLRDTGGREWVVKIVHPAEDPALTDLQSRALIHIGARAPGLPVPRVRMPRHGDRPDVLRTDVLRSDVSRSVSDEVDPRTSRVRMYSYLPGTPMHLTAPSPALRRNLGRLVAALDLALVDLRHPAGSHDLAWDAHRVARIGPFLEELEDRDIPLRALEHFTAHAAPRLGGLRAQIIHNDGNPHNILTTRQGEPHLAGIIDFGDLIRAPLAQDVATAAAYQIGADGHPMAGPAQVIAAFHEVCPLRPEEVELLYDLIVARLVLIVGITGWRSRRHPGNGEYIRRNNQRAWDGLRALQSLGCAPATGYLRTALGE